MYILDSMVKKTAVVKNSAGIHVRPSGEIFKEVETYPGKVEITSNGMTMPLDNVMVLLAMGLVKGSEVTISVDGPDEEKACSRFVGLFEKEYDFPPR